MALRFRVSFIIFFVLALTSGFCSSSSVQPEPIRILWLTSRSINKNDHEPLLHLIDRAVKTQGYHPTFIFEQIDEAILTDSAYSHEMSVLVEKMYPSESLDLILADGLFPFQFLKNLYPRLFAPVPVVYWGIPEPASRLDSPELAEYSDRFIGHSHTIAFSRFAEVIQDLHPDCDTLWVVSGEGDPMSQLIRQSVSQKQHSENHIAIRELTASSMDRLGRWISERTSRSAVMIAGRISENLHAPSLKSEFYPLLCRISQAPVYSLIPDYYYSGMVGTLNFTTDDCIDSTLLQIQWIIDKERKDLPVNCVYSTVSYLFDWTRLEQFNIPENSIPENSIITNTPQLFFRSNEVLVWIIFLVLALLVASIVILEINAVRRSRVEAYTRSQRDLGIALSRTKGFHQSCAICLKAFITSTGMECGIIYLLNQSENQFRQIVQQNLPDSISSIIRNVHCNSDIGRMLTSQTALIGNQQPHRYLNETDDFRMFRDIALIPVVRDENVIGGLLLARKKHRRISRHTRDAFDIFATQLGDVIVNKQAEDALRENEQMYRNLVKNAPTGILYINRTGDILDANPRLLQILGSPSLEETQRINMLTFPRLVDSGISEVIQKAIDSGMIQRYEHSYTSNWGKSAHLRYSINPLKEKDGSVQTLLAHIEDITEAKRTEHIREAIYNISELAHTAGTLPELYQGIHNIISGLLHAENFYIALYYKHLNMLTFPYFIDESDSVPNPNPPRNGLTEYVLQTGKPLLAPLSVFNDMVKEGVVEEIGAPSIDWLGIPLKSEHNETFGVMVLQSYSEEYRFGDEEQKILTFVSDQVAMSIEHKRAEEELKQYRDHLEDMVEKRTLELNESKKILQEERDLFIGGQVAVFKWMVSDEFPVLFASPNVYNIFGYSADDFISGHQQYFDLVHPDDIDQIKLEIADAIEQNKPSITSQPFRVVTADSTVKWLQNFTTILPVSSGKHQELLGYVVDITDRISAESELRDKQAQLIQAGRLAALGEMATGVAHELNQPLSIIRAQSEVINFSMTNKEPDPVQIGEDIDIIIEEVDRAASIINHMRSFSRGNVSYSESILIAERLFKPLIFFQEQFRILGIQLDISIPSDLSPIEFNPQNFEQIVVNLLSNAKLAVEHRAQEDPDYTDKRISISARVGDASPAIMLEVTDTGIGMTPDVQKRCLEPFFTDWEVGEGSGLGLTIVHSLMKDFSGTMEVESTQMQGTTMRIIFPPVAVQ